MSPHLAIYQAQLTWYLSGAHRITGCIIAGSLYVFLVGYAALPYVGYGFDSNAIVSAFGALPLVAKIPIKLVAGLPVVFHVINGVRHLTWDTASQLTIKAVYRTGYIVMGLTAVSLLGLTFM